MGVCPVAYTSLRLTKPPCHLQHFVLCTHTPVSIHLCRNRPCHWLFTGASPDAPLVVLVSSCSSLRTRRLFPLSQACAIEQDRGTEVGGREVSMARLALQPCIGSPRPHFRMAPTFACLLVRPPRSPHDEAYSSSCTICCTSHLPPSPRHTSICQHTPSLLVYVMQHHGAPSLLHSHCPTPALSTTIAATAAPCRSTSSLC